LPVHPSGVNTLLPAKLEKVPMSVGPWQIVIIALVVLLLFGATRLGDIGKGLGEGIRNFKKGVSEDEAEDEKKELSDKSESEEGTSEKSEKKEV
jgi:sec-independent protein translocase protein TatA